MRRIIVILIILILAYPVMAQLGTHAIFRFHPHTFADLQMADMPNMTPHLEDGAITYCTDCAIPATPGAKCTKGIAGAEAHRIRGQWSCF